MPPKPPKPHTARLAAAFDRGRIDQLLQPWVSDANDRDFLVRCVLDEGPVHHRGANYVLLSLLAMVLERVGGAGHPAATTVDIDMRLPPHLEDELPARQYPLGLAGGALDRLAPAGSRERAALLEALGEGPPQHVVANVMMVDLLETILGALEAGG